LSPLLAVHLPDGILAWPWLALGWGVTALAALWGTRRIADEEIPRVAVLSSAFFVATFIHVPVPLPGVRVHLLLNGLVGVILGRRAALAIPLALVLQALLAGHGGLTTLGVNTAVMLVPALAAGLAFRAWRAGGRCGPAGRSAFGVLAGSLTVMATAGLNALVLAFGGGEDWPALAYAVLLAHVPVAVVEGLVTGAALAFLARVKPEMLGLAVPAGELPPPPTAKADRQAG
jgi:cobalt/nickel transport system permease protein